MLCSTILLGVRSPGYGAENQRCHRTGAAPLSQPAGTRLFLVSALASAPVPQAVDVDEDAMVDVVPPHNALDHIAGLERVERFLRAYKTGQCQAMCVACEEGRHAGPAARCMDA